MVSGRTLSHVETLVKQETARAIAAEDAFRVRRPHTCFQRGGVGDGRVAWVLICRGRCGGSELGRTEQTVKAELQVMQEHAATLDAQLQAEREKHIRQLRRERDQWSTQLAAEKETASTHIEELNRELGNLKDELGEDRRRLQQLKRAHLERVRCRHHHTTMGDCYSPTTVVVWRRLADGWRRGGAGAVA